MPLIHSYHGMQQVTYHEHEEGETSAYLGVVRLVFGKCRQLAAPRAKCVPGRIKQ